MKDSSQKDAGGGVTAVPPGHESDEAITASSLGVRVTENVRRFVNSLRDGEDLSVPVVYEWFLAMFPETQRITIPASFKVGIKGALDQLCGKKLIHLHELGSGGRPHIYRKGQPVQIATVERSEEEMIALERNQAATRAAAVELAYVETWGEHSPKSTEVLRMVVEAAKS